MIAHQNFGNRLLVINLYMEDKKINITPGIGLAGLLTIIFAIAKLTGHFAYSWWWVFAPLLISWAVALVVVAIVLVVVVILAKLND